MSTISIRLPDELVEKMDQEAGLAHKKRSELVREAIDDYLRRLERERFMAEIVAEARAAYSDPAIRREALDMAEEGLQEWVESIEAGERAAGIDPDEKWWK